RNPFRKANRLSAGPAQRPSSLVEALERRAMLSAAVQHVGGHPHHLHHHLSHHHNPVMQSMLELGSTSQAVIKSQGAGAMGTVSTPPAGALTPARVRHAYGFDQISQNGTGQTIAI